MAKKSKGKTEKIIFDFMRSRSASAKKAAETRWERAYLAGEKLSKKGEVYIEKIYGPIVEKPETGGAGGGVVGGRSGGSVDDFGFDEWPDVWDFEDEEADSPAGE